jgi:diaminopimelate epimerase
MAPAVPPLRFAKMHGAGNDFVVLDLRGGREPPEAALRQHLADRHRGVGCDQLIAITDSRRSDAVAGYLIWNADGSEARQCGNGARCVAAWLVREGVAHSSGFELDSPAGPVQVGLAGNGDFRIGMGRPEFEPDRIPLLLEADGARFGLDGEDGRIDFAALSMGNPHAVIEVADVASAPVARIGPWLQAQPCFPQGVNVGFAQVLGPDAIALRVYERGSGETLACGSGACAAVVALARLRRIGREGVRVHLPGGELVIDWPSDDAEVMMAGPAEFVFEGEWIA